MLKVFAVAAIVASISYSLLSAASELPGKICHSASYSGTSCREMQNAQCTTDGGSCDYCEGTNKFNQTYCVPAATDTPCTMPSPPQTVDCGDKYKGLCQKHLGFFYCRRSGLATKHGCQKMPVGC